MKRSLPAPAIAPGKAQPNNRIVIYELPTTWTKINVEGNPQIGVGTFRDVLALVDRTAPSRRISPASARWSRVAAICRELGVNALELLPLADSFVDREWGYATSNYFAPDYDLGFPAGNSSPTSNTDLIALVTACHGLGIRFIIDVVMAFGTRAAMENVNFDDFHIDPELTPNDPDTPAIERARHARRLRRSALALRAHCFRLRSRRPAQAATSLRPGN